VLNLVFSSQAELINNIPKCLILPFGIYSSSYHSKYRDWSWKIRENYIAQSSLMTNMTAIVRNSTHQKTIC